MSIDWVTVLAQLANFLVLVWLLRRFLYLPILNGIDAREAAIARRMAEAEAAHEKAMATGVQYEQALERTLAEQEATVAQALAATEHEREQIMADARRQLKQEQAGWGVHLERERQEFIQRLHQAAARTVFDMARKVLVDLADEPLEAAIARKAAQQIRPLVTELGATVAAGQQARVSTHQPLAPEARQRLDTDLQTVLPGVQLDYATDPEQSPGLILQMGGVQLAWTIDSYMDELDDRVAQHHAAALRHEEGHDGV
ncbi:hypothetical protein [Castellaniella sp.]|uniref:F0F1 ATP synthase subunit B family protein n=1 Tax=Castellaniella sp. TaxID=1955812 RepID=UPI00355FFD00